MNSSNMLFMFTLLSGVMITISSNSWISAWMGLEINLLSFIPLMMNNSNIYTTEAALKYFLIQALASSFLLFYILVKAQAENILLVQYQSIHSSEMLMLMPMLMKSGAAPLHWWFPSVMEGLSWKNCAILMTLQKVPSLILISYLIKSTLFSTVIILMSVIIGSIGGLNQMSLRKLMTYSSINHLGWMLSAMLISNKIWMIYITTYIIITMTVITTIMMMNSSFINQMFMNNNNISMSKFMFSMSLLSLGGLPPFLGFMPKWLVIQQMINNGIIMMMSLMVMMTLLTLFYYMQVSYTAYMIMHSEPAWSINIMHNMKFYCKFIVMMSLMSIILMPMTTLLL
uniref:NADH dehydrogenase subunit 2 n=1 Tax=Chorisoserrata biceps TaxID=3037039 RepID=UPI0027AAB10E|nr:NADH dehydrogenase subunit 2 [Chorisoserrata biceps]WGO57184.1 NADH dehydrogenase subunit 2 [Chorisoserrata biceps]